MRTIVRRERLTRDNAVWALDRVKEAWREGGIRTMVAKSVGFVEKRRMRGVTFGATEGVGWQGAVMMIASRDPVQCWHYRVFQKIEAFEALGIPFMVVEPTSSAEVLSAVQLASLLIIYRQPDSILIGEAVDEAHRLSIPVAFEVDDIVYSPAEVEGNPNLGTLPAKLRAEVIAGAASYQGALLRADVAIGATPALVADLAGYVDGPVALVENGVDALMLEMAEGLDIERAAGRIPHEDDAVTIGYGSGSRAHDADLAVAAPAIARLMSSEPRVRLKLMGPLAVPTELAPFADRITRVGLLPESEYLWEMAQCDIAIAPLLDIGFNAFKSQVKYMEAALLRLPFVASETVYGAYVDHGRTGLIARTEEDWFTALAALVADADLRRSLGEAARADVQRFGTTTAVAGQLDAMLELFAVAVPR